MTDTSANIQALCELLCASVRAFSCAVMQYYGVALAGLTGAHRSPESVCPGELLSGPVSGVCQTPCIGSACPTKRSQGLTGAPAFSAHIPGGTHSAYNQKPGNEPKIAQNVLRLFPAVIVYCVQSRKNGETHPARV